MDATETASSERQNDDPRYIGNEETFWGEDSGVIVLEAEGKLFRARTFVLRLESQIFRDMLSLPQPMAADAAEQHEGKPLVHLADKAAELQLFLKALHQNRLYFTSTESQSLRAKAAILRLSTKYEVSHLRKRMIEELSSYFPSTLAAYDVAEELFDGKVKDEDLEFLVSVIEETNAQILLPIARYMQCRRIRISPSYGAEDAHPIISSAIPTLIIRAFDIQRVIASPDCKDLYKRQQLYPASCTSYRESCLTDIQARLERAHPLHPFSPIEYLEEGHENLCRSCGAESARSFLEKRTRMWDDLPGLFRLPSWAELRGG